MHRCVSITAAFVAVAIAVFPVAARAQSFRCVGKDGKRYYGQVLPRACLGQPYEKLNQQGMVIEHVEPVKKEDPAAKAAEEEKQHEKELAAREEARRSRALLATYTDVTDIDAARARALAEPQKQIADIEANVAQREKKLAALTKEKPNPSKAAAHEADIETAKSGLAAQQELLAVKKQVVEAINARYDEDKKRYLELTHRR
jgi:hypothetical protein